MTRWSAFCQPPNSYTTAWDSTVGELLFGDLVGVDGALEDGQEGLGVTAWLIVLSEAQLTAVVWLIGSRIWRYRAYLRVIAWRLERARASGCLLDAGCTEHG